MKKLIIFFGLLGLIMSAACRKKAEDPAPTAYDDDLISILDSNRVSGILTVTDTVLIQQDSILVPIDTIVQAQFYDIGNHQEPALVNSVSVNSSPVTFYPPFSYQSSLKGTTIIPATWTIKGSGDIPDFTYTNLKSMPEYAYKQLPSTIDRSKDLIIPLTGFKNTKYVTIIIDDHIKYGILFGGPPGDSKSFTFEANSLSQLTPNPKATIEVRIENINYQTLGFKTFGFVNEIIMKKKIALL